MKIKVCLNGTDVNPYHRFGLRCNPFPQTGNARDDKYCMIVQELGGDPIPNVEYIREKLKGFSAEFVDLCVSKFVAGEYVEFTVEWKS